MSGGFDTAVIRDRVTPQKAIAMVALGGRPGFTTIEPDDLARFEPTDAVELPAAQAYRLVDVDPGREFALRRPAGAGDLGERAAGSASCAERVGQPLPAASAARRSISSGETSST